jgi:phage tail sheath protein FI
MSETFLHGVQVLEVDNGARPIRTVRSSVIGLVGAGNNDEIAASRVIGTSNGAVRFTADEEQGASGNRYYIEAIVPAENNQPIDVSISGDIVTISLATNSSGVNTSTATQVVDAVNSEISGVVASLPSTSNGSSVYVPHGLLQLTGGVDATFPLNTPVLVTNPRNLDATVGAQTYIGRSLEAIYKQAGAVVVVVRTDGSSSDATDLTGVYALKRAQAAVGFTPRILVVESADDLSFIDDVKSVAASCRAIAVVGLNATTPTQATAWVNDNGNDRTYAVWPLVNDAEDPAPYVAGVIAKTDNDRGFWWSPSNQEVLGITSLASPVDFQLGDSTSLANVLNEGKVTTFIRQGGFRVWGNLTGSIDPKWEFLNVRRTADIINDSILANHLWAVDRNITRTYLEDVADGVNAYLATLTNLGAIIGGQCWPDPALNSPDQIALGKVYFNFEFTAPSPAQTVTFRSILTNDYLSELID